MRKWILRYAALVVLLLFSHFMVNAQEEKFKAIFLYNFTRYVDWPDRPGNFVITVFGNDAITSEIQGIAAKKTVGTTKIEVKTVKTPAELTGCHILYIPGNKTEILKQLAEKTKESNVLIVTDIKDACLNGSCINFVNTGGKISYEISRTNIESHGLKVSGELIQLGTSVN
jgi:hypothetical protein